MSQQDQMRKLFRNVCSEIDTEEVKALGLPLMLGGNIPTDAHIPEQLKTFMREGTGRYECHQALKEALIDTTQAIIEKEKADD